MRNGFLRVATAAVGVPVVIGGTYVGGWPFVGLVLVAALAAQWELYALLKSMNLGAVRVAGLLIGLAAGLRVAFDFAIPAAVTLSLACTLYVLLRHEAPWRTLSATLTGVFYPTVLLTYLIEIRAESAALLGDTRAFWLTLLVLALVWASDTSAYYVGKAIGRHPLAPTVSPKKTWEGAIGGAVGSIILALVVWRLDLVGLGWPHLIALGLICGAVGQLGDLAESRLKRVSGTKDSGTILPGHGGLLDRLDAMIVAVPLAYLYLSEIARVI